MRISAETGFRAAPDDVLDLLEKARGVGLQLVGHEVTGRVLLCAPLGLGLWFTSGTHTRPRFAPSADIG
jgi:hypothetical protein